MSSHPSSRDTRIHFSLGAAAWRLATVDEHAQTAAMDVDEFLDHLEPYLSGRWVTVEAHDGVLFLDTSPKGTLAPGVHPNLWSCLRRTLDVADAARRWDHARELEHGGWRVELRTEILERRFGAVTPVPWASVEVQGRPVPLVWAPSGQQISEPGGVCDRYAAAGEALVAVTCDAGRLEDTVAAVRAWVLGRGAVAGGRWLSVLVLEAPAHSATLLRCTDNSVTPTVFARSERTPTP